MSTVVAQAEFVVAALAPRGPLLASFRDANMMIADIADRAGARLVVVGGYSSLRPAPGADRFVADLSGVPTAVREEVRAGAALILDDLPATPPSLDWIFISPALRFGAHAPADPLGRYELGDEVAIDPQTGGHIAASDYALGVLDLIELGNHHRAQVNLGNPG